MKQIENIDLSAEYLTGSPRNAVKIMEEKVNELVLVANLLLKRDEENCLKNAEKEILESLIKAGENFKVTKASCNKCGAGKKLYWSTLPDTKTHDAIATKVLVEKTDIRSTLYVQDIKKGCPKCGGELIEEL